MRAAIQTATATVLAVTALLWTPAGFAADLEVVLEGIHSEDGRALVALHRKAPDVKFPADAGVVANEALPARTGEIVVVFPDLAPGDYAVAAFHDANDDGELNANFVGMPTEGYGFSNAARGFMGPPSFEAAGISIAADDGALRIVVPIACPGSQR